MKKFQGAATSAPLTSLALGLGCALAIAGCVATAGPDGATYVRVAPPVAVVEVSGVAPGPDRVWIRGYHTWDGQAYAWRTGRWEARPRASAIWVDGRWAHTNRGWYWTDGRWR